MKLFLTYIILFISGVVSVSAQKIASKGVSYVENYLPNQYGHTGKVWSSRSASNGMVYMASDNGLLEFDGKTWNAFKHYEGFTRSLLIENDSVIYTGADMDFGVWRKNKTGQFNYTSLFPFKQDSTAANEEFWNVFKLNDAVLFISFNNIYVYRKNVLTKINAPQRFTAAFLCNNKIYLAEENLGLLEFNGIGLQSVFKYPNNYSFQITGIYENEKGLNIITQKNGVYQFYAGNLKPVEMEVSFALKQNNVFSFTNINNQYWAFGTILNGLYITDTNGKIIQHINKNKGLLNNTILSMHFAKNGQLWLGMDFGIASIHLTNSISYLIDYKGSFGTAHTAQLKDSILYLGTNQGLYKIPWSNLSNNREYFNFSLIGGSEGQVWSLFKHEEKIWCGHDKGLYLVEKNALKKIHTEQGVLTIKPYKSNYLLTGNYNGINLFKKNQSTLTFVKKIELIKGSVHEIEFEDDQFIWASIPTFGLIRFSLNDNFYPLNRQIFPIKDFIGASPVLFKDKEGIKVQTHSHLYVFNRQTQLFDTLKNLNTNPKVYDLLSGNYVAAPLNNQYGFYPIYNGFALEYFQNKINDTAFEYPLQLRKAEAFNNKESINLFSQSTISFLHNNFRFQFIVPVTGNLVYQYKLENYSKEWSNWKQDDAVEFINLKEGHYKLLIRAQSENKISNTLKFEFTVLPPWYRSWYAYIMYVLFVVFFIYLLKKWRQLKLKKQKLIKIKIEQAQLHEQAEKYKQELLLKTQEQLENEKKILQKQVRNKTIELAKKAKQDEDNIRLLRILKDKMHAMDENPAKAKIRLNEMRRLLDSYLEIEDKTFEIQMDELHQEFFKSLKEKFPVLSIYDLRMCAYIKIGLNSKEMAEYLQVLPSSINMSRSRIRKKLGLKPDEDLYQFLNKV